MNSLLKLAVLFFSLLALSGCATQPPTPEPNAPPLNERGAIRVEAEGIAYMGDTETLGAVRQRAWDQAMQRAAAQGAQTYLDVYRRTEFGTLTEDVVESAVAGVLTEVKVLEEGLEGATYKIRLTGVIYPEDIRARMARRRVQQQPVQVIQVVPVSPATPVVVTTPRPAPVTPWRSSSDLVVCCKNFPNALAMRVRPTLERAPGVEYAKRVGYGDDLCYQVGYNVDRDRVERWLKENLRTSSVNTFTTRFRSENRLDLNFDGGFD